MWTGKQNLFVGEGRANRGAGMVQGIKQGRRVEENKGRGRKTKIEKET